MTDKQIIINEVDVSWCEWIREIELDSEYICTCNSLNKTSSYCKDNPNCYYKQLARKEQEYEELRQYHNKCCEEFENEKQELLEKYNQVSRDFHNGKYCNKENCSLLKAKEQECEELKVKNQKLKEEIEDLITEIARIDI